MGKPEALAEQPTAEQPTVMRYAVLAVLCSLSMLTYLDRVCFGSAGPEIVKDLGLSGMGDLSWAIGSFIFAYAAFEIPTGWLGDVFGPKNTLFRIVLWWSAFTAATGLVGLSFGPIQIGFWALVAIRFLFGIGEAGAYPNITRALHNWFPTQERGFAQGTMWMSGRLMGGLTPLVWMFVVAWGGLSWRTAFWIFGGLGVLWCLFFAWWFRDRPEQMPGVNAAELEHIQGGRTDAGASHADVPWGQLFSSVNLWALCFMYFCAAYGWYFNITYLPSYMDNYYGVSPKDVLGSIYKGGPLWLGSLGCLLGGFLTDWYIRTTSDRVWGRRLFGIVGHVLCGCCWLVIPFLQQGDPIPFFVAISLAAFFNDLTMGPAWSTCQDIGQKRAAIVAGVMNSVGNMGGTVAGLLTGFVLTWKIAAMAAEQGVPVEQLSSTAKRAAELPGYMLNFYSFAAAYFIAALLWLRVDATEPVFTDDEADDKDAKAH